MTRGPRPSTRRVARVDMPDHSPRQPRYGRRVRGFRYDRPRHKRESGGLSFPLRSPFLFRVIQARNEALLRILLRTPRWQGMLNRSRERLQFEIPIMSLAVDEECWGAVDAASDTARKIALNPITKLAADERLLQSASI